MASPVGLAIRNEKAQQRINDALALLSESFGIQLPDDPARTRDPFLREMLRMEWTAETLEVLASASIGRVEPLPDSDDQEGDPEEESSTEQESQVASDEQADQEPEQDGSESEQTESDEESGGVQAEESEPEAAEPSEVLDASGLKKLKLDELKTMASERGIEDVQDVRSKDEVIEKLMEGSE